MTIKVHWRPLYEVTLRHTLGACMDELKRKKEVLRKFDDNLAAMNRKRECQSKLSDWQRLKCRLGYSCECDEEE